MRMETLLLTFFPQREALVDAEPMLFINDDQRQSLKLYLFLKQSMGADDHRHLTAGDRFLLRLTRFAFLFPASQPTSIPSGANH
jgi:hypothetical protein